MASMNTDIDNISTKNPCSICLLELNKDIKKLKCKHNFHKKCIDEWINTNNVCPLCRYIIPISKPVQLPSNIVIPINSSRSINIINNNNNNNNNNYIIIQIPKIIKTIFIIILYCLALIFFISSSFYNDATIFKANNYINKIIINMNSTELNGHNKNTYGGEVIILCDIIFFIFYIILNSIIIFGKLHSNACKYAFLCGFCMAIGIIRSEFYKNTSSYLNDKELDIENEYYNNQMQFSIMLFGISCAIQVFVLIPLYINRANTYFT
jgi:hypothetical protein